MSKSPTNGKRVVGPKYKPQLRYLLDNCLNPFLADALRLADWDIVNVCQAFNCKPTDQVLDEDIIPWCASNGRILISADESARRDHELALKLSEDPKPEAH